MNRRERVLAALNHREPDRVPIDFGSYSGATSINVRAYQRFLNYLGIQRTPKVENCLIFTAAVEEDILDRLGIDTQSVKPSIPLEQFDGPEEFFDKPWGVRWRRSIDFTYAPVHGPFQKPLDPSVEELKKFRWPSPSEIEDLARWRENAIRTRQCTDRALVARLPIGIVTTAQILRGFEGWATDLYLNRRFSDALHERLAEIWIETSERMMDALNDDVDILFFGDDYGAQNQPMLDPRIFRERIKPLLKQMVRSVKVKSKAKLILHSCGCVYPFLEDFIDIGIDGLNPLQSNAKDMAPAQVKRRAGKDLALWGGIDTHTILPRGTPGDVKEEVKRKLSEFGEGGGYVLSSDHNILLDVPPENLLAMFEAAVEFGRY